jgi:hypothetical protein
MFYCFHVYFLCHTLKVRYQPSHVGLVFVFHLLEYILDYNNSRSTAPKAIKSHMPTLRKREKPSQPSSPIRRRITRATSHISDADLATKASTPEGLEETAPSSSAESSPDRVFEQEMLHREGASRRTAKNIEDVNDIEEKGLYRTNSNSSIRSNRGDDVREKLLAERQRDERSPSVEKEGLNSKRDKEAFALLVVLCKLLFRFPSGVSS